MNNWYKVRKAVWLFLLLLGVNGSAIAESALEGTWQQTSFLKGDTQVRYKTQGYMMFGKEHWLHVMFINRDKRPQDFSEAHHGTYQITGPDTLDMTVEIELHMDPKTEFQETPVLYGDPVSLQARYHAEGGKLIIDFPSNSQFVLQRVE